MIEEEYFEWLCKIITNPKYTRHQTHLRLFRYLFEQEFYPIIELDRNRALDGIALRAEFADENGYFAEQVAQALNNRPCSVLEMMVALSVRCEKHIMQDDDYGDRTRTWFWSMLDCLGLNAMDDSHYDETRVCAIVTVFLNRTYEKNGKGGLFCTRNNDIDMRDLEIWYQMFTYLDEQNLF